MTCSVYWLKHARCYSVLTGSHRVGAALKVTCHESWCFKLEEATAMCATLMHALNNATWPRDIRSCHYTLLHTKRKKQNRGCWCVQQPEADPVTLPSPSPIRQSYESLLCDIASLCIRIQNPIQLECNQTLRRISRRQWPTFSQSGAQKWSSHTLGRLNYATDSANAVWMCSGASHLRTAACRDSILESIICSPAALAVLVQTRKQWETQSNDFNFLF